MKFTAVISKGGGDRILEMDKETAKEAIDFAQFLAQQQDGFLSFVFTEANKIVYKQTPPSYTAVIELGETREKIVELIDRDDKTAIDTAKAIANQYGGTLKRVLDGEDPVYIKDALSAVVLKNGYTYAYPTTTDNLEQAIQQGHEIAKQKGGVLSWILDSEGFTMWSNDEVKGMDILYVTKINGEIRTAVPFDVIHDEGKSLFFTDDYKIVEYEENTKIMRLYEPEYSAKGLKLYMIGDPSTKFACKFNRLAIRNAEKIFPMYLAGGWMESMLIAQASWDKIKETKEVPHPNAINASRARFEFCAKELDSLKDECRVVRDSVNYYLQSHTKPQPQQNQGPQK